MRIALVIGMLGLLLPGSARAGLYWQHGVRSSNVSVCFVGDAVTSRPARVQQVLSFIREYEWAANVHFVYTGTCPASVRQPNGNDSYAGDVRIVIPNISVSGTGMVPGVGCPAFIENGRYNGKNDGWGSWSNAPDDLETNRSCLYNMKLGDDGDRRGPYLNHTLHEFGHALGLAHEHERADANAGCTEEGYRGTATAYLTTYDRLSVMHYKFSSCGINGNYDDTGLSAEDRLSVHILYPEVYRVAEIVGTTVIPWGTELFLQSAWLTEGGESPQAVHNFQWRLNGSVDSTGTYLSKFFFLPGSYSLDVDYEDLLGRWYSYHGTVRVLFPSDYTRQISAPTAARLLLL